MNDFETRMSQYRQAVEEYLAGCFTEKLPQKQLFEAMRYSLLAGGKRIRPILVLEFCRICGGDWNKAMPLAAAIEMIHTYSLIHDDLPCMDDDDYRRGRLTNHKVYGEATAVLAGDALLTAAFDTAAGAELDAAAVVRAVKILAGCSGEKGMVGGQILDMDGETRRMTAEEVHTVHRLKTGGLITAACCMGVAAAGGSDAQMQAARDYAAALGLAFQIRDDMLDVLGDEKKLGKAVHTDGNKSTFVSIYGLDACGELIAAENRKAMDALAVFEDRVFLEELTRMLAGREF